MNEEFLLTNQNVSQGTVANINYCNSCNKQFVDQAKYRVHYKSDLHTYNLKRKIVNLTPISEEVFVKKLEMFKLRKLQESTLKKKEENFCEICNKKFKSKETL